MRESLTIEQLCGMLRHVARTVVESEPELTGIDSKIGDGDHGTGMAAGFSAVAAQLCAEGKSSVGEVFLQVGNLLLDTMGGASGVLFGTLFISGVIRREPESAMDLEGLGEVLAASLEAIKRRGRAQAGDKTMVDALEPAVAALRSAAARGMSLAEGLSLAEAAARAGVERTKALTARFGRARSYGEQALGIPDPGAVSVWLIFRAMWEWVRDHPAGGTVGPR